jgi:hypothetical protein
MVNADRVKRKLPSLLINGETTDKKQWATRRKIAYRLAQLKKHDPTRYQSLEAKLMAALSDMEKAVLE